MKELTKSNFDEAIHQGEKLVVVDFWAAWCGPCRMMEPVLEELSEELGSVIDFCKLNVDGYPDIAMKYGVRNIPTMLFFKDGEIVDKAVGAMTKGNIEAKFENYL